MPLSVFSDWRNAAGAAARLRLSLPRSGYYSRAMRVGWPPNEAAFLVPFRSRTACRLGSQASQDARCARLLGLDLGPGQRGRLHRPRLAQAPLVPGGSAEQGPGEAADMTDPQGLAWRVRPPGRAEAD